ncbi:TetR/AcrR family transcriptional regulator [Macromonas nakdongensis]|jgi:AcrR family transcriptional regulator|uniref:TetR/AcrR family transcriptional regulator n=1 Tax=Macromonas nakdongensis TaxID=1843082 RepID=UPI000C3233C9|nr:TetR/AcrR family transcriptional regulator [Macromonas nakdongensis]
MHSAAHPELPVKERLRVSALCLFARQGYTTTAISEVCAMAGVSKGAFYHHYASKDELLYGVYQPLLRLQLAHLQEIAARPLSAVQRLREAALDVVLTSIEHLEGLTVFMQSMHLLAPDTRAQVRQERRAYHRLFRGLVEAAQADGDLRPDVPADLLTHHFFGPVHYLTNWFQRDGPWRPEALAQHYADLWLNGVRRA